MTQLLPVADCPDVVIVQFPLYSQITVSEMSELIDEAVEIVAPSDSDLMTFSQFKRMMQFSAHS